MGMSVAGPAAADAFGGVQAPEEGSCASDSELERKYEMQLIRSKLDVSVVCSVDLDHAHHAGWVASWQDFVDPGLLRGGSASGSAPLQDDQLRELSVEAFNGVFPLFADGESADGVLIDDIAL
jgi:hypothetical protein